MPLYQQGGLSSSKGTLQGLPQIVKSFLDAKRHREELGLARQKMTLDEELSRAELGLSERRTAASETTANAMDLYRKTMAHKALNPEQEPTLTLDEIMSQLGEGQTWTGDPVGEGNFQNVSFKPVATGQTINVNTGDATPLEKSTKGFIEKEIESIDGIMLTMQEIDKLTEDSFLTYPGQVAVGAQKYAEKVFGSPVLGNEKLAAYSAWKAMAQELYLQKRKQITGVAARPEEAAEIAQAVPDPTKDSPTQFRTKQAQLQRILQKHKDRLIKFRAVGIKNPTKEQLAMVPLATDDQTSKFDGISDADLEAIVMQGQGIPRPEISRDATWGQTIKDSGMGGK